MKRRMIIGFVTVFLICSGFAARAFAGSDIIPQDYVHVHDFSECRRADAGYFEDRGMCAYLYGTDENHNPIYKDDCRIKDQYQWCNYVCRKCGKVNDTQTAHSHYVKIIHSVIHP